MTTARSTRRRRRNTSNDISAPSRIQTPYQRAALANADRSLFNDALIFSASLELTLPVRSDLGMKDATLMPLLDIPPLTPPGITMDASSCPSMSALLGGVWSAELAGLDVIEFDGDSTSSSSSPAVVISVAGDATPRASAYDGDSRDDGGAAPLVGAGAIDEVTGSWLEHPYRIRAGSSP